MTLNMLRTKVKKLESLLKEFSQLDALIKAMDNSQKQGLDISQDYYDNVKKRMAIIKTQLEEKLANV